MLRRRHWARIMRFIAGKAIELHRRCTLSRKFQSPGKRNACSPRSFGAITHISGRLMIKALTHSNGIWYTKKGFYGTSYIHTMKKIIFLLICCCVSFNVNAQWYKKYLSGDESNQEEVKVVCDTVPQKPPKRMVERPRLLSRVGELGFKYNDLFGRIDCWEDRHKDIAPDLPPLKGMKYRTFTTRLPKARNFSRDILAVKSPKKDTLLSWAANMIAKRYGVTIPSDKKFKSSGEIADFVMDNKIASYRRIENELTVEDWDFNEQEGILVADVWHSGDTYTFFYSSWIDSGFHLSMTESWFTINAATGKEYTLFDFIDKRDEAALIDLIAKYLWNHQDRWIDKYPDQFSEHPEWLLDCSGAALTKNGLIVYYHAPQIGCYADGQFNAVIPYEELKSLPHGLLMDIQ